MVSQEDNLFHASGFDELQRMHSKLVSLICVKAEPGRQKSAMVSNFGCHIGIEKVNFSYKLLKKEVLLRIILHIFRMF